MHVKAGVGGGGLYVGAVQCMIYVGGGTNPYKAIRNCIIKLILYKLDQGTIVLLLSFEFPEFDIFVKQMNMMYLMSVTFNGVILVKLVVFVLGTSSFIIVSHVVIIS